MEYQLIVMDMDGTLTTSEKKISPRTRDMLLAVQEHGVKLVLASGRPTAGLYTEAKILQMERYGGYLLSFNGGHVCSYPQQETLFSQTLNKEYIAPIINNAKALNFDVSIHYQDTIISDKEDTYKLQYEANACHMKTKIVADLRTLDVPMHKILVSAPPEYLKQRFDEFRMPFGDLLSIYTSAPFYIEVVPNGINKGASLAALAQRLQIPREKIIAFGDEMNDLTMLQYAGHGVAMGNAVKAVKLVAKEVTASNDEDGIACSLEKLFPDIAAKLYA